MRKNETGPQPMRDRPGRKFTLADIMILVAVTAVGAMLVRIVLGSPLPYPTSRLAAVTWRYGRLASPFLLTFPAALLVMRARAPRPPARRVFRQPGTVACLVVLADVLARGLLVAARSWLEQLMRWPVISSGDYVIRTLFSGYSVALVWAAMGLTRTWRPEAGWIDRTGRAYGMLMITVWLLMFLYI
jgi:hypothetical protein